MANKIEKTQKQYWDKVWRRHSLKPNAASLYPGYSKNVREDIDQHELFKKFLHKKTTIGKKFIEVGCACSVWLPYFAKEYGFSVTGLDYSEIGLNKTKKILDAHGLSADLISQDIFDLDPQYFSKYDYLLSRGVVEHFEPTEKILEKLAQLLKKNGYIITTIPNMSGLMGKLQKLYDKEVYDGHVPLDKNQLEAAHRNCGFKTVYCGYLTFLNIYVVNAGDSWKANPFKVVLYKILCHINQMYSDYNATIFKSLKPNQFTSPYIVYIGKKL